MTSIYTLMFKVLSYLPCLLVIGSIPSCKEHTSKQSLDLGIAQANQRFEEKKENIIYPKSSAVIDVTGAEYGAVPNDGKDDTRAIQKALSQFPNRGKIIYLPNGVYNISDTLHWPRGRRF
ncbi:glycosyl hydrolase family 28-related protein, partial [Mastigocoleus sp. MO_188.B34]|uniref:glycosyl hydrolase family 28-related protein n=1 Tax=Mastigocoleus sp. MO_188.B34 TaxID=3036635 RepID=UPI002632DB23